MLVIVDRSDSSVFCESNVGKLFNTNKLSIPLPWQLYKENATKFPYAFLGDEAYPLSKNLLCPFSKKGLNNNKQIFNYW